MAEKRKDRTNRGSKQKCGSGREEKNLEQIQTDKEKKNKAADLWSVTKQSFFVAHKSIIVYQWLPFRKYYCGYDASIKTAIAQSHESPLST